MLHHMTSPRTAAIAAIVAVALTPCMASAQTAEDLSEAWATWAESRDVSRSTMAVVKQGEVLANEAVGADPGAVVPLASLSKSITAACVQQLIAAGRLAGDKTAGEILSSAGTASDVTVAELLTHSGGLGPDETQGDAKLAEAEEPMTGAVVARAASRESQTATAGEHAYNNENYAFLGQMIAKVSGQSYEEACRKAVLAPAGVLGGGLEGRWAAQGPWGGWALSAAGFAKFFDTALSEGGALKKPPEELPHVRVEMPEGAMYGMGMLWASRESDHVVWNVGQLCWEDEGDGAYVARFSDGGPVVVVTWTGCLAGTEALAELDRGLAEAALPQ